MSKRRINKQQSGRIQKIQANYRQQAENNTSLTAENGLVLSRFSRHADIEDSHGNRIHCSIRPNIDSLVAGDRVIWQAEGVKRGVVVSRYPRTSVLGRPDKRGESRPVAANITQVIIVVAAKPELTWSLLDSYLVMVEQLGLEICIVLNKVDLDCEAVQKELIACYQPLGYRILFTSKEANLGYDLLKQALNHQTSVFVGQSGVGKSSLISGLLPHESNIQTAEISANSELGCHTTSNSRYYHLPSGGALIDSPGVREFGLWHMPDNEITQGYREFRPLISQCKFRNCNHRDSPGCAIIKAINNGELSQKRYDSYLKIIAQFG
ncbi:Putative ribosome biogenesis GTPase RsgA [Legionella massiliensis]|uniref:Small ribosomal subunit biogenesis GTPase RsgA n=1 Tax=Legionella massiliensis TaxID=1034943 RepID=A0A078KY44_9GAMM|nr:small ribosomal subunit biogenesis GTPase RsgA [Legionella massiliensis]CDZ77937.1 Putative ribosome biogenesis GTPase RsgA [Legionella massiliensis]CEE13675.1 Putative ribosome biogenesis GTPase RsgA [Legionella massiliensis]